MMFPGCNANNTSQNFDNYKGDIKQELFTGYGSIQTLENQNYTKSSSRVNPQGPEMDK